MNTYRVTYTTRLGAMAYVVHASNALAARNLAATAHKVQEGGLAARSITCVQLAGDAA